MDDAPQRGLVVGLTGAFCVAAFSRPALLFMRGSFGHPSEGDGFAVLAWIFICTLLLAAIVFFARRLNEQRARLEQKQSESTYVQEHSKIRTALHPCEGFFHLRQSHDKQRKGARSDSD